jgi:hypothetical protein
VTLLTFTSLFDNIEAQIDTFPGHLTVGASTADRFSALTLRQSRELVHGPSRHAEEAQAIWREVLADAASDPVSGGPSALLAVWFTVPRLRRAVRRISSSLPADRADLEAEAVHGVLEGVHGIDPLAVGAGERLMRAAATRAWRLARSTLPERPVADPAVLPQPDAMPPAETGVPDIWTLHIAPPDRAEGLAAPLRFSASRQRVEGERLGALAEGLGLRELVHRARRPGPGRRIGTLTLHPYERQR